MNLGSFTSIDVEEYDQTFVHIMSSLSGDTEIANLVCEFVNNCFELRNTYLSSDENPNAENFNKPTYTRVGRLSRAPCRLKL